MTIALDATPLTVPTGGVARYTWELACALAEAFPQDRYWLLSDQPFDLPPSHPPNVRAAPGAQSLAERKWWLWGLRAALARLGADVFHGTDFAVPYLPARPAVMTIHDLSPWAEPEWQPRASRIRRRTPVLLRLGLASMVITPSEAVRRAAIQQFRLDPDRVAAVPLAAASWFQPAGSYEGPPYFLFVGTLEPRKNVGRLIEAWREVRREAPVELWIVGRVRDDYPAPQAEPGLRWLGAVPDADLPGLYSGALAAVYPSLYEGFGLPVLEAMQCGAPVITSRDPAVAEVVGEVVGEEDAAIRVEARDVRALAEAMRCVANSAELRASLRARGLNRARAFSWNRTALRTHEIYERARSLRTRPVPGA